MWPVENISTIGTPYGARCCGTTGRPHYWGGHVHKGIDVPGPVGTQIRAAWSGVVTDKSWGSAFGTHIVIDNDKYPDGTPGYWVVYAHLSKKLVSVGQRVEVGQVIGLMGATGNVTGSHLHMEVQTSPLWYPTNHISPDKLIAATKYWQDKKVYESKMVAGQKDSDSVRNVQSALNSKKYYLTLDGNYTPETVLKVANYQKAKKIVDETSGIVGPQTAASLGLVWVEDPVAPPVEATTLGTYLKSQGHVVNDENVPYGRPETVDWQGVKYVMLHHTASPDGGSELAVANDIKTGGEFPPKAQIMMGQSGTVWMCTKQRDGQPEPGRANHAGTGKGYGIPDDTMNAYSIGVEVQASGTKPLSTYPNYPTVIKLLADLCRRYNLKSSAVIGHKEWSTTGKIDPLDNMDVVRLHVAQELGEQIEPEEDMYIYNYSGLAAGTQKVGPKYIIIQKSKWTPPVKGLLQSLLYANATYKLKAGREAGTIRIKVVYEAIGTKEHYSTGYRDITVSRNGAQDGTILINELFMDECEAKRPLHWEMYYSEDFESMTLGTRYTKWALLPKE